VSFELRYDESLRKGIRRIVGKQLDGAQELLSDSNRRSVDERIHSVRKRFKRVRAVARLVRDAIGESAYRMENDSFRDAGRPLSEVRDAKVLLEALDTLKEKSGREARHAPFRQARKALIAHQREVHKRVLDDEKAFTDTASAIEQARERLADWSDISNDWQNLGKGTKRVYRQGRKAFDQVKADATVENLHEWRKQVKYLRHQLELLAPTWPKVVGELASQADSLGELLGADHDLAVLGSTLASPPAGDSLSQSADEFTALIESRRKNLQLEAISKGELLYRDSPKQFLHRLEAYWQRWFKKSRRKREASYATASA
jgi:CHAD domain-containing protein